METEKIVNDLFLKCYYGYVLNHMNRTCVIQTDNETLCRNKEGILFLCTADLQDADDFVTEICNNVLGGENIDRY